MSTKALLSKTVLVKIYFRGIGSQASLGAAGGGAKKRRANEKE